MTKDKNEKGIGDLLKRVVSTGVGAAFMTEEAVRGLLDDLPLKKDIINGILQSAKHTREAFIQTVKTEIRDVLGKVDVQKEIERIVENYDIEVSATFKFHPKKKKNERSNTRIQKN
jgi:polyhydroxyalkanoate synthesis regulator phasin